MQCSDAKRSEVKLHSRILKQIKVNCSALEMSGGSSESLRFIISKVSNLRSPLLSILLDSLHHISSAEPNRTESEVADRVSVRVSE